MKGFGVSGDLIGAHGAQAAQELLFEGLAG